MRSFIDYITINNVGIITAVEMVVVVEVVFVEVVVDFVEVVVVFVEVVVVVVEMGEEVGEKGACGGEVRVQELNVSLALVS